MWWQGSASADDERSLGVIGVCVSSAEPIQERQQVVEARAVDKQLDSEGQSTEEGTADEQLMSAERGAAVHKPGPCAQSMQMLGHHSVEFFYAHTTASMGFAHFDPSSMKRPKTTISRLSTTSAAGKSIVSGGFHFNITRQPSS